MDNKSFKKLHGFFIEDIKIGQTAENKKIITEILQAPFQN